MRTFTAIVASHLVGMFLVACAASSPTGPGSVERSAATVADHRARCPSGTTLKQSRHANERLKVLVCLGTDGKQHGPVTMFDAEGRREMSALYQRGKLQGPFTQWHPSGAVFVTGHYVDGLEHGLWKTLSPDGRVIGSYTMTMGSGHRMRWHRNGTRAQAVQLVDGEPQGRAERWHPNGARELVATFERGRPIGVLERFHANGKPAEHAVYGPDGLSGIQRTWSAAGVLTSTRAWRDGKLHGRAVLYDERGRFKTAACFNDDKLLWDVDALRWAGAKSASQTIAEDAPDREKAALERACLEAPNAETPTGSVPNLR